MPNAEFIAVIILRYANVREHHRREKSEQP